MVIENLCVLLCILSGPLGNSCDTEFRKVATELLRESRSSSAVYHFENRGFIHREPLCLLSGPLRNSRDTEFRKVAIEILREKRSLSPVYHFENRGFSYREPLCTSVHSQWSSG